MSMNDSTWYKYRYFVRRPDGALIPSGSDNAPTLDTYKAGDSMGVKDGKKGFIVDVQKGNIAKSLGCDVVVVIEERPCSVQ